MTDKILLTGVQGQLGRALQVSLKHYQLITLNRSQCDLSQPEQLRTVLRQYQPDIIINTAAYTAVDRAETEIELAYAVNATAPHILAEEALALKAKLIHFSTDYVFEGTNTTPYKETDATSPISVYGKSKLAGEQVIQQLGGDYLIFRTSWVYAPWGKNFLNTMLRLAGEREQVSIVNDQYGAPTSALAIAAAITQILPRWKSTKYDKSVSGIYHLTNTGKTTWHAFAVALFKAYEANQTKENWPKLKMSYQDVQMISTAQYPTLAKRPAFSVLDNTKLNLVFDVKLPTWQNSLIEVIKQITPNN